VQISRKDIGYAIYSRLEEALRFWLKDKLLSLYGMDWRSHIPKGIWDKVSEALLAFNAKDSDDPLDVLNETDIPDLMEIVCFKSAFVDFVGPGSITLGEFRGEISKLYEVRCKIAHVKLNFAAIDLDVLIEISQSLLQLVGKYGQDLRDTLDFVRSSPEKVLIEVPADFFIYEEPPSFAHLNNLPSPDYDPDGGFIGRKEDLTKIQTLLLSDLHRVVTISGAGGMGKTAVAHRLCQNLLFKDDFPFAALVWVSAKEEKLTVTGIEPIEPTFRTYEEVLENILITFGWKDEIHKPLDKKEESVRTILEAGDKGILLVVDNLETIQDDRVMEFIKDFPPRNKVLITSRMGLGEVERRYPLKEMSRKDAITLFRTVAREKGADDLARMPEELVESYVDRMSRYPLAIKWVVGQVALGKDLNLAVGELTSSTGDVARFCFEHIFERLLDNNAKMVLYSIAAYDKALSRGILTHLTGFDSYTLDEALRDLTIASLVVPNQVTSGNHSVETRYDLVPLTRNYIQAKLAGRPEIKLLIQNRMRPVENLIQEAERAGKEYRYSLRDMGAETEEEKIAATWAFTASQKYQAGDYEGSVEAFRKSAEIAPNFHPIYRNWADMEAEAGFYEKADELMRKATSLNQSDSSLWFVWGNIEKRRQRYDRSSDHFNKALELSPDDPIILGALGEVEKRRGNFEKAGILLLKSAKLGSTRWNEIVCFTSLADNLRRWAEALDRDKRAEESLEKLRQAHQAATHAAELGGDLPAKDTLREVSSALGAQLLRRHSYAEGRKFLEQSITINPRRYREKKTTAYACYLLAKHLIRNMEVEEAKKYYEIGYQSLIDGSGLTHAYKELEIEFSNDRCTGTLYRVIKGKGYGFLEPDGKTGESVYIHISNITPKLTVKEFESLLGAKLLFTIQNGFGGKGPEAKAAKVVTPQSQ
jgi:LuxR family transcriptional regulator, glucitol operon activator